MQEIHKRNANFISTLYRDQVQTSYNQQDLEKGKAMPVGTVHNGYKKVKEGVWKKVSEHGLTKKEHEGKIKEINQAGPSVSHHLDEEYEKHKTSSEKLDDKDYSDTHVLGQTNSNDEHPNVIEDEGKLSIDTLDADSGEKKIKEGAEISHRGNKYVVGKEIEDDIHALIKKGEDEIGEIEDSLEKSVLDGLEREELLDIVKGGKKATVGEIRTFGGRDYIRTVSGWKFHGKGTGAKAQEHKNSAAAHNNGNLSPASQKHIDAMNEGATEVEADQIARGKRNVGDHSGNKKEEKIPFSHDNVSITGEKESSSEKSSEKVEEQSKEKDSVTRDSNWAFKAKKALDSYKLSKEGDDKDKQLEAYLELQKHLSFGDIKPFFVNDKTILFTGPGPMKISNDHDHESYYFKSVGAAGSKEIAIPSETDIKMLKEGRKKTLDDIKKGGVKWFTPGGYVFSVRFTQNDQGGGTMYVGGRPNSAVGSSILFESIDMKKMDMQSIAKKMEQFNSRAKVRAYMKKYNGKKTQYQK